jgi:predicted  nucleic acid-binding Zn-ribbon protein
MSLAKTLRELQQADLELGRLERRLAEMPEKRAILEARKRIEDIRSLKTRTDAFVAEIEREIKRYEDEVAIVSAKLESEQAKLLSGSITNPKEVQHISRELDALKRNKDRLENHILGEMEKRERAFQQQAKVDHAIEDAQAKEAELVEGFKGKGGTLQAEIDGFRRSREALLGEIDDETRLRYESLIESKGGVAVGILSGATCGACRMELPADRVDELVSGPDIGECPLCHRLLIVRAEDEPSEA